MKLSFAVTICLLSVLQATSVLDHSNLVYGNIIIDILDVQANEIRDVRNYKKIIALGDIHGSFDELIHILYKVNVTDENGTWIARNLLLIQVGDLMDRGENSLTVIDTFRRWSLEAPLFNSSCLITLGNHEIMHLYHSPSAKTFFNKNELRELGFWSNLEYILSTHHPIGQFLRGSPAIRIIGNSIFVHAGLDTDFLQRFDNNIHLINAILKQSLLFDNHHHKLYEIIGVPGHPHQTGPFWDRSLEPMITSNVSDICHRVYQVLRVLNVTRIIVGHNAQMDMRVKSYCNGHLWLIDCDIKSGGMSALLIENDVAVPLDLLDFHVSSDSQDLSNGMQSSHVADDDDGELLAIPIMSEQNVAAEFVPMQHAPRLISLQQALPNFDLPEITSI